MINKEVLIFDLSVIYSLGKVNIVACTSYSKRDAISLFNCTFQKVLKNGVSTIMIHLVENLGFV